MVAFPAVILRLSGLSREALTTRQFANTLGTGLTPGLWVGGIGLLHGVDRYLSGAW
jgi:hypothetical protein